MTARRTALRVHLSCRFSASPGDLQSLCPSLSLHLSIPLPITCIPIYLLVCLSLESLYLIVYRGSTSISPSICLSIPLYHVHVLCKNECVHMRRYASKDAYCVGAQTHAYIPTYLHTYIHTYAHMHTCELILTT